MSGKYFLRWQNKTIAASSDLRGVLIIGLLVAWFYFLWQLSTVPPFAAAAAHLPPLLQFMLSKGQYMPDFAMIVAGFASFHFFRQLRLEWDRKIAVQVYLAVVVPLVAYLALGLILLEAVHYAGPAHAFVLPWQDPLMGIQFRVAAAAIIFAILFPIFLFWMWNAEPDFCWSGVVLSLIYYGLTFHLRTHRLIWMWPPTAVVDFILGVTLCSSLFRGIEYVVPVRGAMIILGWLALLGGSIIDGPSLFFLGFLLVVGGTSLSERTWFLPGERLLLLWSRTTLGIALVQPAVLTAWVLWGSRSGTSGLPALLLLAVATQILALVVTLIVTPPARRLMPVQPA
jgi:hypothetical protein